MNDRASHQAKKTPTSQAKRVRKGWGEERWLVEEGSPFGFKMIVIRSGQRTSLQYHLAKEEANLVISGTGLLHSGPVGACLVEPLATGDIVHVHPGVVHRIEATTDMTLVEVSTPELDDVIRLEDDWHRAAGRIEAEHEK